MKSSEVYKIHKNIFDTIYCDFELTEKRLNDFLDIIANDDELNDRHYDLLRRYALKKFFESRGILK